MNFRLILLTLVAGAGLANAQTSLPEGVVGSAMTSDAALVTPVSPAPLQVVNPFTKATGTSNESLTKGEAPQVKPVVESKSGKSTQTQVKKNAKSGSTKPKVDKPVVDNSPAEVIEEVFEGERIGSVNGLVVFRGSSSYLFKPESKTQVKQTLSTKKSGPEQTTQTAAASASASIPTVPPPPSNGAGSSQKLPSIVGGPSPSLKPAFSNAWGSTSAPAPASKSPNGSVFNKSSTNAPPATTPSSVPATGTTTNTKKSW